LQLGVTTSKNTEEARGVFVFNLKDSGKRSARPPFWLRVMALLLVAVLPVFIWTAASLNTLSVPSFQRVRATYATSEAVLLDRHNEVLHEFRVDSRGRRLKWVGLEEISPALQAAVISAEDKRFYQHRGVDWKALGGVLLGRLSSRSLRGASTITMQLVSKLTPELQPRVSHRSHWQKWKQVRAARSLEETWSKTEILEAYLNLVTFRGELQGIASASRGLFGKRPDGLNDCESMILASLVRAPSASIGQVAERADKLSKAMNLQLSYATVLSKTEEALSGPYGIEPEIALAPHVYRRLLAAAHNSGKRPLALQVMCTLDQRLQRFASETLGQHILSIRERNVHDGAVLVVDNASGEVLAYVGNVGDRASAPYVDGTQARRQAGSILKPFLYALAFDGLLLTPASLLEDAPLDVPAVNGIYRPENYDKEFHGVVTARMALASSLNIPAVKVLNLVGVEAFVQKLSDLGFESLQSADFYGPSLALGSADVTLWELVNAYRALANGGIWSPLHLTFDGESHLTGQRLLSAESAFIVSDILSDRESRSETFNLESPLSTRFWTGVKTGTSKDMRDNWCVGFSDHYTVAVWVGNFSGEPMWNVSGITGAAPVWIDIMNWLHRELRSRAPIPPKGVVARQTEFSSFGRRYSEWFLKGTETSQVVPASSPTNFKIVYPASGTIIALDPDIPEDQQKLFFEADPKDSSLRWRLDGEDIGTAGSVLLWGPQSGKHVLELVDTTTQAFDSVSFEVRGNLRVPPKGFPKNPSNN
jgi:penicillin-binding protein 1C